MMEDNFKPMSHYTQLYILIKKYFVKNIFVAFQTIPNSFLALFCPRLNSEIN